MTTNDNMMKSQEVLFEQVYLPIFVEKCAEKGIVFNSEEDLHSALESAAILKLAKVQSEQGSASVIKQASAALRKASGMPDQDVVEKSAALLANEDVKNAVANLIASKE